MGIKKHKYLCFIALTILSTKTYGDAAKSVYEKKCIVLEARVESRNKNKAQLMGKVTYTLKQTPTQ